jgi:Tol biopolymer transport system component
MAAMNVHSCGQTWSPDRSRIAFHSKLEGDSSLHLYVVNADGTNLTRLTNDDLSSDGFPIWSPDGTRIAFVRNRAGNPVLTASVYTIGVNGTGLTRVADDGLFWPIDWSPDGQRLAYSCTIVEHANTGLCTIGTNGAGRAIVADNVNRGEIGPAWSPDGQRIAYVSAPFGVMRVNPNVRLTLNMGDLHVVGSDGTNDETIVSEVAEIRGVTWSLDGTQIAFAYRYGQSAIARERSDLYLVEVGGAHAATRLTNYDGIPQEQMQLDVDPDWQ